MADDWADARFRGVFDGVGMPSSVNLEAKGFEDEGAISESDPEAPPGAFVILTRPVLVVDLKGEAGEVGGEKV